MFNKIKYRLLLKYLAFKRKVINTLLIYTQITILLNKLRLHLIFYVNYVLKTLCILFIAMYYYYKVKNTNI